MSDTQGKELLEKNLNAFEELKGRIDSIESKSVSAEEVEAHKTAIEDIKTAMADYEEKASKIAKELEIERTKSAQLNEIDKNEVKRAQVIEFGQKMKAIAMDGGVLNTLDMKSFKDFESKAVAAPQFNSYQDGVGGLAVMPEIDSMLDSLVREFSNIRQWCSVRSTKSDVWKRNFLNKTNGALRKKDITSFTTATKTDTLSQITIPVHDLFSILPMDSNLIDDDMIGFVNELLASAAEDFILTEGEEFVNGDGKGEFMGIEAYADGTAYNQIERYTTANSTSIVFDDIHNLVGKLKTAYQRNSAFYMHRDVMVDVRVLKDSQNQYLWQPSNILGQPATLAGYPVREMPELDSDIGTAANEVMIFGDLRGYTVVDRQGVEVQRDPYSSYPDVLMKLNKRSGGGLTKGEMLKILKIKA